MISLTCSLASITVTVTIETYVEMLQKIFPEDSPDISTSELVSVHLGWSTANTSEMAMKWLKDRFPENLISLILYFLIYYQSFMYSVIFKGMIVFPTECGGSGVGGLAYLPGEGQPGTGLLHRRGCGQPPHRVSYGNTIEVFLVNIFN